ncbi:MAG: PstS family phosphate ABC transporter substrate-binding protein [Burkholderiaceae bacterium]
MPFSLRYADIAAIAMCMLLMSGTASAGDTSKSVHIRGSTTLLPLMQRMGEAYMAEHPDVNVVISGGGTARGYKAILDGTADIAMASGAVSDEIADENNRRGIKLHSTTLSYGVIVAVVHPSNAISNLSMKQLRNIFTGRINNWKELGGKNAPIKVFVGPPTGGITDTWKRLILGDEDTYTPSGIVMDNADRIEHLAKEPLAITFLTIGAENNPHLKILKIDGVIPNADTVHSGSYPLRAPLMMVTTETPSAATKQFIQYFSMPQKMSSFDGVVNLGSSH